MNLNFSINSRNLCTYLALSQQFATTNDVERRHRDMEDRWSDSMGLTDLVDQCYQDSYDRVLTVEAALKVVGRGHEVVVGASLSDMVQLPLPAGNKNDSIARHMKHGLEQARANARTLAATLQQQRVALKPAAHLLRTTPAATFRPWSNAEVLEERCNILLSLPESLAEKYLPVYDYAKKLKKFALDGPGDGT